MDREAYVRDICSRSTTAVDEPFRSGASIGHWIPQVSDCHANVDHRVAHHADYAPVRGWLCNADFGAGDAWLYRPLGLRDPDGALVDLTPIEDPNFGNRWFVEHLGDEVTFPEMRTGVFIDLRCQGN